MSSNTTLHSSLPNGRFEDALDGCIEHGVELHVGLLGLESLDQRSRKAGHDAVMLAQPIVGFPVQSSASRRRERAIRAPINRSTSSAAHHY